jgi:hypothetical protein
MFRAQQSRRAHGTARKEIVMTSTARPDRTPAPSPHSSATVLAVSAVAALVVGLLMLAQNAVAGTSAPATASRADVNPPPSHAAERLDAGVDWSRVEFAPEPDGTSVAAYEQ